MNSLEPALRVLEKVRRVSKRYDTSSHSSLVGT